MGLFSRKRYNKVHPVSENNYKSAVKKEHNRNINTHKRMLKTVHRQMKHVRNTKEAEIYRKWLNQEMRNLNRAGAPQYSHMGGRTRRQRRQ
jgi:hypothetical protein